MKPIIIFLAIFTLFQPGLAQREYYFIEVESQDSMNYEASYGKFNLDKENKISKDNQENYSALQVLQAIEAAVQNNPDKPINVFLYIHGMWGHQGWYQKDVLSTFENEIFADQDNPAVVISFIWHSGINYWDNVHHALAVGKYFSDFFEDVIKIPGKRTKVLCHSMGNRVFQGIKTGISGDSCTAPLIDELYMVAADLETNIFGEGNALDNIGKLVQSVIVYVHNNDRSLGMSRSLNENARLGLDGDKSLCLQDSCLEIVDVSTIQDNEGFGPALSNHRYFYTSPTVRNDLRLRVADKENPDYRILDHPRRLLLIPLQDK